MEALTLGAALKVIFVTVGLLADSDRMNANPRLLSRIGADVPGEESRELRDK